MKALLDTHAFLWWITDDPRLSSHVREIIADGDNELFLSAASGWEMAIKAKLGKLHLPDNPESFVLDQLAINAIESYPFRWATLYVSMRFPSIIEIRLIECLSPKPSRKEYPS